MGTFPIISRLGGRESVCEALNAASIPTTRDRMKMWHARERLPADIILGLMRIAEARRIRYRAADFDYRSALRKGS